MRSSDRTSFKQTSFILQTTHSTSLSEGAGTAHTAQPKMLLRPILRATTRPVCRRRLATGAPPPPPPHATPTSRLERINRRLPKFLHKHTSALASAPLSHITSFLILHEITAIVPLFGLAATFHYTHWLPSWFAEGAWVLAGVEQFGKYFKRKGWVRGEDVVEAEHEVELRRRDQLWNVGEGGARLIVEFATAYTITKALLPLRVMMSVWATPWFARTTTLPVIARFKRLFSRKATAKTGPAAGTGAVQGGAVPKGGSGGGS
jgi:hypothetical protein